jgi:DNA-binding transcriptional MerR regulator
MYSIGEFSKINKVTTKTLRHYDEIELLKPEHVDKFTGYRYYTSAQLPQMHKIMIFKQMGLSLAQIKEVMENPNAIDLFLKLKEQDVKKSIEAEQEKLKQIQNYIYSMKGDLYMKYDPIIKQIPEVIVASMRQVVKSYDEFFNLCPNVMAKEMERLSCVCASPAYCFNIFHDGEYKEKDIDVEICEAVTESKEDTAIIKFKTLPKVTKAVCVFHKGGYGSLGEAYGFIFKWIEDNGYEISDKPRQRNIDGIWNKDNEADWLTEIQIPVL